MSTTLRVKALSSLVLLGTALTASSSFAGSWESLNYGGSNTMTVYEPTSPVASPPIVVSLHSCGGQMVSAQGWFQSYAEKYGFLVIAGKSTGGCWDAGLGRSGERATIVQAVDYVIKNYNADKTRVFAAGASSGACMTQALLASYPDVFAAGSSLAGVPAGAWTGRGAYGWTTPASTTAQQWADKVRQADPGFSDPRPRIQLWQGQGDTTLTYSQNYPAEVAQWTNVLGVTESNATKASIRPSGATDTWARTSYKDSSGVVVVEANSGPSNVPHDLTGRGLWADVVRFFGLDGTPVPPRDGGVGATGGTSGAGGSGAGGGSGKSDSGAGGSNADPSMLGSGGVQAAGSGNGGSIAGGSGGASSGGMVSAGGTSTSDGFPKGSSGHGGSAASSTADPSSSSNGCSCAVEGRGGGGLAVIVAGLAMAMLWGLRRGRPDP